MREFRTLTEVLNSTISAPGQGITFIYGEKEENYVSYSDLYDKALYILYNLQGKEIRKGDELLFQIENPEYFLGVFWACILGGIIPVPVAVGNNDEHHLKVFRIWEKLKRPHLATTVSLMEKLKVFAGKSGVACNIEEMSTGAVLVDELESSNMKGEIAGIHSEDIAFIQFSSGSTGAPKGVVLTHDNLTANIYAIIKGAEIKKCESLLSWMPLTHDMGLIGFHLTPLFLNINQYILPTSLYIRHPKLWMDKVYEHKVTLTASPNFGYQYFLKAMENKPECDWDLSCIRLVINGAEPISADLCEKFLMALGKYGLRRNTLFAVYGLAEASLAVTFPPAGEEFVSVNIERNSLNIGKKVKIAPVKNDETVSFVDLGYPVDFCDVRIINENNHVLEDDIVGCINIKGSNVTKGYYNDAEKTAETITRDGWLSTGDLGFTHNRRLIITGRAKDVIIINGQNYYPHDIERVAEALDGVSLGEIAAGSFYNFEKGKDSVLLFVLFKKTVDVFVPLAARLKNHIRKIMGLEIDYVVPVKKIPKTTSGKIERYRLVEKFKNEDFKEVLDQLNQLEEDTFKIELPNNSSDKIEETLLDISRSVIGAGNIGFDDNLIEFGGNSILLNLVHLKIEEIYPGRIKISDLFTYPTVRELANHIRGLYSESNGIGEGYEEAACSTEAGYRHDDIAIIGVAAKLPIVDDMHGFWEGVRNGICYTTKFHGTRKNDIEKYLNYKSEENEGADYFEGSYLEEIDKFDPLFFKISPNEASLMNPTQRLFLETAYHAVEDAGYGGDKLKGSNVGIYAGQIGDIEGYKYKEMIHDVNPELLPLSAAGNISTLIPNRISYALDVKGPSMIVDTACSSSLVALHTACQAIRNGDCDSAIVGSARISYIPLDKVYYRIGIESSDYMTRTFDKYADGSGVGEGVAAMVIKPVNRALADGDNIYAVIKGSAVNQDGASMGITVPNAESQSRVLMKAWKNAGIDPQTLTYIEAHGTGTKIGDVIEIDGLQRAFSQFTSMKQFCAVGSVKSNLGHLYDSAGLTGLLKAVLSLKYRELPPTIGFNCPNDKIDFSNTAIYVNTKLRRWDTGKGPRRCGVSSFGIGGTNCHVVLEEAPVTGNIDEDAFPFNVIALSARSMGSLSKLVEGYNRYLNKETLDAGVLGNICYTANTGRGHYTKRIAVLFRDQDDIKRKMSALSCTDLGKINVNGIYFNDTETLACKYNMQDTLDFERKKEQINKEAADKVNQYLDSDFSDFSSLEEICRLYVNGADIDWERLYIKGKYHRLSLPVYPFERKRCWITIPETAKTSARREVSGPENIFYKVNWKETPLPAVSLSGIRYTGPVLIMKDHLGLGDMIAGKMRQNGIEVVEVCWGEELEFEALADLIKEKGITVVLHLFSYGFIHNAENGKSLDESQDRGVFCLLKLIKALNKKGLNSKIEIVLISNFVNRITGEETEFDPESATLFGLGKVAGLEHSMIKCRCIDVDDVTGADRFVEEIGLQKTETLVAYRKGIRYVEELGEIDNKKIGKNEIKLESDGVYVITGGLGGIGIEIARWMALKKKLNIALINRSKFPERAEWEWILKDGRDKDLCMKISYLKEIENNGSQILLHDLDISKLGDVQSVFDGLREKFGRINGVIHAAGIAGGGLLLNMDIETLKKILLPKVWGTWALDKATENDHLDFFALFSSALTLVGDIGRSGYVAANAYLDAFTSSRNLRKGRTLTINWVEWGETGMSYRHGLKLGGIFKPIDTGTGLAAFERLLVSDVQRAIVGEIDTDFNKWEIPEKSLKLISSSIKSKLQQGMDRKTRTDSRANSITHVKLSGRTDGAYTDMEKILAGSCQKVLGFAEVNIHDSFFEMGADSIRLKSIFDLLDDQFPGKLSITDLFAYTSVYKLSVFLDGSNENSFIDEDARHDIKNESFSVDDALECIRKM
jgi:acyl transferase domain-containing protein/acyl-CoA synthetase (AMP-forming)/AMP-acid ligase II/acyl carrier protein